MAKQGILSWFLFDAYCSRYQTGKATSSKMAQYKGAASEGSRAMQMMKKREQAQEEVEFRKKKIEEELKLSGMKDKFASHYDAVEQQLKVCFK